MSLCLEGPERKIASHEFLSLGWDMVSHVVYVMLDVDLQER